MKREFNLTKKEARTIIHMLDTYEEDNWGSMDRTDTNTYLKMREQLQMLIGGKRK